jgi:hypothetical protein
MNNQSLNGLIYINANEITTNTIDVNETYTNKNITMEYSVISNALETFNITTNPTLYTLNTVNLDYYYTFNSTDFSGLSLKNK